MRRYPFALSDGETCRSCLFQDLQLFSRAPLRRTAECATLLTDPSARKDHRDAGESPRVGGRKKFPPPSLYKETTRHGYVEHIRR